MRREAVEAARKAGQAVEAARRRLFVEEAGGVIGYFVVGPWQSYFPYLLVIASSSFIYVAVADLIPQLQHRLTLRETAAQLFWLGAGLAIVLLAISQLR